MFEQIEKRFFMYPSFSDKSFLPGAIYLRLSKDDEGAKESLSIANQRKMLLRYAAEHGLTVIREYVDDGYSGTSFDRPGFKRMIEDIEKKEIGLVLTKDLSRLGRDYIKTGNIRSCSFLPAESGSSLSGTDMIQRSQARI